MGCECLPSKNIVCGPVITSIGIYQPECQVLPDGSIDFNPVFNNNDTRSYFTYSFLLDCDVNVLDVYFLVCEDIDDTLIIDFQVQSCGYFINTDYTFQNPPNIFPPPGLRYVRVMVNGIYGPGVCVLYRLSVLGNYINSNTASITVLTMGGLSIYTNDYIIPGCNNSPSISIGQSSEVIVQGSSALLRYLTTITNTGNKDMNDIVVLNDISYDSSNINLGQITTIPDDIEVILSEDLIQLSTKIPTLAKGESTQLIYNIPIESFNAPNTYTFASFALAAEEDTEVADVIITETDIGVVGLDASMQCYIDGDIIDLCIRLKNQRNSPETNLNIYNLYRLFDSYVVEFLDLSNCIAQFQSGEMVELNVPINTEGDILISCLDVPLTPNTAFIIGIKLRLLSINYTQAMLEDMALILDEINISNIKNQVLLPIDNLPLLRKINTNSTKLCD